MAGEVLQQVWSPAFLDIVGESMVAKALTNSNFQRDAQNASKVRAFKLGRATIAPLDADGKLPAGEKYTPAYVDMDLNLTQSYNVGVGKLDEARTNVPLVVMAASAAGKSLAEAVDADVLAKLAAGAGTLVAGTQKVETSDEAMALLRLARVQLSKNGIRKSGRRCILDAETAALVADSPKFQGVTTEGVEEGFIGRAYGFDIFESSQLPDTDGVVTLLFGHPDAATFADNLDAYKEYVPDDSFDTYVAGAYLYGIKVHEALGILKVAVDHDVE